MQKCMEVSPNITDYFNEERYLAEMDQPEQLTPHIVEIMAVDLLLDELSQIGLETNQQAEEIAEYPTELNTVLDMRTAFDAEKFYQLLKSMKENQFAEFQSIVEECENSGDMLFEVTDYCAIHFTTDERWQNIQASAEHWWWSTDRFRNHINALIDKVIRHSDPNKSPITDANFESITIFLLSFRQRKAELQRFVNYLIGLNKFNFNQELLGGLINNYDKDKLEPENLPTFAEYFVHPEYFRDEKGNSVPPKCVINHHFNSTHHMSYWGKGGPGVRPPMTKEYLIMIIGSMFLDNKHKDYIVKMKDYLVSKYCKDNTELTQFANMLVNLNYRSIVDEGVNNEAVTE